MMDVLTCLDECVKFMCLRLETQFVYLTRAHHSFRQLLPRLLYCSSRDSIGVMADFLTFTSEQIAASPPLDPVFEHMLRSSFVHENVITAIRVQKIRNAATFAAMDSTAEDLKETCKEAFGIDPSKYGISHKVEWANVHNAWLASKVNVEVKTKVEAVTRAHGQPITLLTADWASLIVQFKTQYGMSIHDAKPPAQSYYESFEERLHNGIIEAETLAHVVSLADEREQIASKPEPPFQMGMHLDATLSLQTKKKYMSTMPTNTESLRTKYRIMTNLWLLAQLRQPFAARFTPTSPRIHLTIF